MNRRVLCLCALFASPVFAGVVAPIPRGIEFPKPAAEGNDPESEDPAAIVERIARNAEGVGERLKEKDTGADTLEKQAQLLKDIDKLLKPPPPMDGGGGGSSMNPPPPMGGMPPPMGGGKNGGAMPPPMGAGGSGQPRPQRSGSRPEPMAGTPKPMPMGMAEPGQGEPKNAAANPKNDPMGQGGGSALPLEDPFTKQIWGHLPERLRQQASQYYREQYMPKYGELLKLYYSNLAEREKK